MPKQKKGHKSAASFLNDPKPGFSRVDEFDDVVQKPDMEKRWCIMDLQGYPETIYWVCGNDMHNITTVPSMAFRYLLEPAMKFVLHENHKLASIKQSPRYVIVPSWDYENPENNP